MPGPGLDDYPCATKTEVSPPAWEDMRLTTWFLCGNCSFYTVAPDCIGCRLNSSGCLTMLFCCFLNFPYCAETVSCSCSLVPPEEVDTFCLSHFVGFCFSISQCKEKGFTDAICSRNACSCVYCFFFRCESDSVLKMPTTLIKCFSQVFCVSARLACPCDNDVPLGCAICGSYFKEPEPVPSGTSWSPGENRDPA